MKRVFVVFCLLFTCLSLPTINQILDRINLARTNPQDLAALIEARYSQWEGATEAVAYLQSAPQLTALTLEKGLTANAQLHANYLKTQIVLMNPYVGCSGNRVQDRVSGVGTWNQVGENAMTMVEDAEEIVVRWIIDGETFSKTSRRNIRENGFTSIGIGVSDGINTKNIVIADFAGGFTCNNPCPNVLVVNIDYACTGNPYTYGSAGSILSINIAMILLGFIWFIF